MRILTSKIMLQLSKFAARTYIRILIHRIELLTHLGHLTFVFVKGKQKRCFTAIEIQLASLRIIDKHI
jgi:hypothetical protein